MFGIIIIAISVLFASEVNALKPESICCEELESIIENKTVSYKTVCFGPDSRLSRNCCRNIEIDIQKHRYAYKTLCPEVEKPLTTVTPTTGMFVQPLIKKFFHFLPSEHHSIRGTVFVRFAKSNDTMHS